MKKIFEMPEIEYVQIVSEPVSKNEIDASIGVGDLPDQWA